MMGIDWLHMTELSALIFFSIVIVTLALMFGAALLFWTRFPNDLQSSAE